MAELQFEVCVVGSGPAGSVSAIRLAQLGHRVCLIERCAFPRPHVGESLSPGIWPIFDVLGLREYLIRMEYPSANEALVCWAEKYPDRKSQGNRRSGLLVERGSFDTFLLHAAKIAGVQVFQPGQVSHANRNDLGWRAEVTTAGDSRSIRATFLVDATGRNGLFPRNRTLRSPRTIAICGYLQTDAYSHATLVEAISDAWCWGAQIPNGGFSTMVFVDADSVRDLKRNSFETFWRSQLSKAILFGNISNSQLSSPLYARDATTYMATDPISPNFLRVGESSFGLDPLSSTGVEKAMQSGLTAAIAIHTMLLRPERSALCAQFYTNRQSETVSTHAAWSADSYRMVERFASSKFWQSRSIVHSDAQSELKPSNKSATSGYPSLATRVRISGNATVIEEPCIVGDEICPQLALKHPSLRRPVAFVGETEITALLELVQPTPDLDSLIERLSTRVSIQRAIQIASWLIENGILEAVS